MEVVGQVRSILSGALARVYRFELLEREQVARTYPRRTGVTFSIYARTVTGEETLRVELVGPYSSQTADFQIDATWRRHSVTMQSEISLQPLDIFFSTRNPMRRVSDIALAFAQCEDALYASSAIPGDALLPAIARGPSDRGAFRDADRVEVNLQDQNVSSAAATVVFVGQPLFRPGQLFDDQIATFFSLWCEQKRVELTIGAHGGHKSHLVAQVRDGDASILHESSLIVGDENYFVTLTMDHGAATIVVNGAIVLGFDVPPDVRFNSAQLGGGRALNAGAFGGHLQKFGIYETALVYPAVVELYAQMCPDHPHPAHDYLLRFLDPLSAGEEKHTYESCRDDEGFSFFLRRLIFALPFIYRQFEPGRHFREEDVRDAVWLVLSSPDARAERESYSKVGRTDLTVVYLHPERPLVALHDDELLRDPQPPKLVQKEYRVEFKIWGRDGYKEAPTQPIKYMVPGELAAAFVMIDRRQRPSLEQFKEIVRSNSEYECVSIHEVPVFEIDFPHFVSFHRDPRDRNLKMVLNILVSIPEVKSEP
jgi:hypothetical protein